MKISRIISNLYPKFCACGALNQRHSPNQFYEKFLFTLYFLLLYTIDFFRKSPLRGKIQDADTGEELIGTTVAVEGTQNGAVTDFEGNFTLRVESLPVSLRITYTGYTETILPVSDGSGRISVKLKPNATLLKDVEIVGQRIADKERKVATFS